MQLFLGLLLAACLLSVLVILAIGLVGMARGGDFNKRHGNTMMRLRVISQGATVVVFLLFMLASR